MRTADYKTFSEQEYLTIEARSQLRHDYVAGEIYAMTGGSLRHNVITLNIATRLREHLRGNPCRVFMSDAKVRIAKTSAYYYPDVVVTCDPRLLSLTADAMVIEQPLVVIEVLSPNSEGIDRREKLQAYRTIPTLREYAMVHQDRPAIEIHRRSGELAWQIVSLGPEDPFELTSLDFRASFAQVYDEAGIELP